MKVLVVTPYLGSTYGGISVVVPEIVSALASQRLRTSKDGFQDAKETSIDIDLITTDANDTEKLDVPLEVWLPKSDYRIRYFSCWHRHDLILSVGLLRWLWQNVGKYDLVHSHTIFTPMLDIAHSICRRKQVPYIVTPHGMLEPWAMAHKAWKKRLYFSLFERNSLKKAAAIQALTTVEVERTRALGFKNAILVPNGIHTAQFRKMPSSQLFLDEYPQLKEKKIILFLGRLDPKKGLDLLAVAFAKVSALYPEAHLVVAGPDSINFLPTAQRYFAEAGCTEKVTFTGMVTGEVKKSLLAAAHMYVAPSYSEGFSMSILEGMASALPCIFTSGCNFSEARKAQVAYEVEVDVEAIAKALIACFRFPAEVQAMGDRAQQFIFEHYTWDSIAQRLARCYFDTLNGHDEKFATANKLRIPTSSINQS